MMMLRAVFLAMCLTLSSAALREVPTPAMYADALKYLGATCDAVTAKGCNAFQLPLYDGTSFVPSPVASVTLNEVFIDTTQSTSKDNSVSLDKSVSSVATSDASGFGIGAAVPFEGITFSMGLQHSKLVQNMYTSDMTNYYSEVSRQYTVFTASLRNDSVTPTDTVQKAAAALPDACSTPAEVELWLSFFTKFGTHYVKSVAFGGTMKMYTFLQSSVSKDSKVQESDWNFNLGVQFDQLAGIQFSWPSSSSQESFSEFSKYTFSQDFFSVGGDQNVTVYDDWLQTVAKNPAPFHTTVSSIKDLIDPSKDFDTALQTYFTRCPHTDNGICNGYGGCDFSAQSCNCAPGTYKDDDGNCYANCLDNCNGNGNCKYGVCQCNVNSDGFGFTGISCNTKCGEHAYNAGAGYCWGANGNCYDICTSRGCDQNAGGTCFCQSVTGYSDDDMHAASVGTQNIPYTIQCDTNATECSYIMDRCASLIGVTCQYGQGQACGSSQATEQHPDFAPISAELLAAKRVTLKKIDFTA